MATAVSICNTISFVAIMKRPTSIVDHCITIIINMVLLASVTYINISDIRFSLIVNINTLSTYHTILPALDSVWLCF